MTSAEKDQIIEALSKQLNESSNFYVTNIANLTVAVTNELRRTCFKNDIKLKVVKNTLLKKITKCEQNLFGHQADAIFFLDVIFNLSIFFILFEFPLFPCLNKLSPSKGIK
jgi:hypothetical protein